MIKYPVISAVSIRRAKTKHKRYKLDPIPQTQDHERPQTRADCIGGIRPCPFVGCRYSLLIDVTPRGSIKATVDLDDIPEDRPSCALDLAAVGEVPTDKIADLLTMTEENVHRLTMEAMFKVRDALDIKRKDNYADLPDQEYV